jgi:Uma2 family endonuclease
MAATTKLMTVEEYRQIPDDKGPFYLELHHGELVEVPRPKIGHTRIQRTLRKLMEGAAGSEGVVEVEIAFRALPEYEMRVADVAYVAQTKWDATDPDDNLHGAPDLVVEVLSPSNTASEIYDKEQLCLANGCREFWVVDPKLKQVKVSTPDGKTVTYKSGQEIPLGLFPGKQLAVDAIFSERQ